MLQFTCKFINLMMQFVLLCHAVNQIRRVVLDNEIETILIHNPDFTDSVIKICVDAGAIYDKTEFCGTAHLFEHMLYYRYLIENDQISYFEAHDRFLTKKEYLLFNFKSSEDNLEELVIKVVESFSKPVFDEQCCRNEVQIVNEEYELFKRSTVNLADILCNLSYENRFPDSRYVNGNAKTLGNIVNISQELEQFHKNYFTGNRIILVLASDLTLEELNEIAKHFEKIPKGELKPGISREDRRISFNNKYLIHSYTKEKTYETMLKKQLAGSLVPLYSPTHTNNFIIRFIIPPLHIEDHKYKLLDYFRIVTTRKMEGSLYSYLQEKASIKSLYLHIEESKRKLKIEFTFTQVSSNEQAKKNIIFHLFQWLYSHVPNKTIFDYLSEKTQNEYNNESDPVEIADRCLNSVYLFSSKTSELIHPEFEFSRTKITEFFKLLQPMTCCIAFHCTVDASSCPYTNPYHEVKYGDAVNITDLEDKIDRSLKCPLKFDVEPKLPAFVDKNTIFNFKNFLKLKLTSACIHNRKFDYGEFIILSKENDCKNMLNINISFVYNLDRKETLENEVFFASFNAEIENLPNELQLNVQLFTTFVNFSNASINIKGKKDHVLTMAHIIGEKLQKFKPAVISDEMLQMFMEQSNNSIKSLFCIYKLNFFRAYLKKSLHYSTVEILNTQLISNPKYYVILTAFGDISREEGIKTFYLYKSKSTESIVLNAFHCRNSTGCYNYNTSKDINFILFGYRIMLRQGFVYHSFNYKYPALSDLQTRQGFADEYIIGQCLRIILLKVCHKFSRITNTFCYESCVEMEYIDDNFYIVPGFNTSQDINPLHYKFREMIKNYRQIIDELTDEDLSSLKQIIWNNMKNIEVHLNKNRLLFMRLCAVYGNNTAAVLKQKIDNLSKSKLAQLRLFDTKPIVITVIKQKTRQ